MIQKNIWKQYLIQEHIDIQQKNVDIYIDGEIKSSKMYYDFCPHLFYDHGKLVGIWQVLVRYSNNKIVNVLRGGGIGYYKKE